MALWNDYLYPNFSNVKAEITYSDSMRIVILLVISKLLMNPYEPLINEVVGNIKTIAENTKVETKV